MPEVARTEHSTEKWFSFYVIPCFPSVKGKFKGTAIGSITAKE